MVVNIKDIICLLTKSTSLNTLVYEISRNKTNYCLLTSAESPNALRSIFLTVLLLLPLKDNCMWVDGIEKECVLIFHREEYPESDHISVMPTTCL